MTGCELAIEPPAPDTPLGRPREFQVQHPGMKLEPKHIQAAIDGTLGRDR